MTTDAYRYGTGDGYPNYEIEESRDAARYATGCYRHDFHPDKRGGGVCQCGETIGAEEL